MGVFAAPCASVNTTTSETGSGDVQQITVTQTTALDLTSEFDCEGGEFEVYWSGEVGVTGTIVIGSGTTVRIFGDGNSSDDISTLSISKGLEELTSGRALPFGLTSAAVGVGPANITSETDTSTSFGPMFYIDGGHLILEDLVVRGGLATNTTGGLHGIGGGPGRGGGVHALNSTVSVTRCYFSDNFAEHWGGGIFANGSTLQIVDSVFSGCDAGFQSTVEDEDLEGAGGGVWVSSFDICNTMFSVQECRSFVANVAIVCNHGFSLLRQECAREPTSFSRLRLLSYSRTWFADSMRVYRRLCKMQDLLLPYFRF